MGERRDHLVMGVDWKAVFAASIDRLLDSSPVFSSSIRQAFQEYQQPASEASPPRLWRPKQQGSKPPSPLDSVESTHPTSSASSSSSITTIPILPPISLLLALKLVLQKVSKGIDPMVWKLSLRDFTYKDVIDLSITFNLFILHQPQPITYEKFEKAARQAFRNMALERGRRLAKYLLGGIIMARIMTRAMNRIIESLPFIGRPIVRIMRVLMPTLIIGPLLGFTGAVLF